FRALHRRDSNPSVRPRHPNPIAPDARPYVSQSRFPPLEAFGRRPTNTRRRPSSGRHPKPFTEADLGVLGCAIFEPCMKNIHSSTVSRVFVGSALLGEPTGRGGMRSKLRYATKKDHF